MRNAIGQTPGPYLYRPLSYSTLGLPKIEIIINRERNDSAYQT